jgi:uncharacterized protein YggE
MKKRTIAIGLVGLIVLSSFLYFVAIPRISVVGTGTVTMYPDEADLTFSVQTENKSAAYAAAENGVIMNNVYTSLSALGVNKSEIKTTSYSLSPAYDSYNYSKVIGYLAVNSVEITVTGSANLASVGNIVDTIVNAGVNQVDGISFSFTNSNYDTLQTEAYHQAIQDAYTKASAIVSGLGGVIIGVASVSTNYGYGIMPPQPIVYGGTDQPKLPTPISSGLQQVTSTVTITYLYV